MHNKYQKLKLKKPDLHRANYFGWYRTLISIHIYYYTGLDIFP